MGEGGGGAETLLINTSCYYRNASSVSVQVLQ